MNYMLLIYQSEKEQELRPREIPNDCDGLSERLSASGHYLAGGILRATQTATSLRIREGRPILTDGPFAETKEQLAGYMLIQAKDLDEAIAIACQHPIAKTGTVEIRPLREGY